MGKLRTTLRARVKRDLQAQNDQLAAGFNRVLAKSAFGAFAFRGGAPSEEMINAEVAKRLAKKGAAK